MNLCCRGFDFCPEVTAKAYRLGKRIHEVPIEYNPRSLDEGKKIRAWHGIEAILVLIKYRLMPTALLFRKSRESSANPVAAPEAASSTNIAAASTMTTTPIKVSDRVPLTV